MFTIETTDDIKVLKELTSLSTDPRIQKLEREVADLTEMNQQLLDTTQKQNKLIKDITESLVTADKCRDIVFDLIQNRSKKENLSKQNPGTMIIYKILYRKKHSNSKYCNWFVLLDFMECYYWCR